MDEELAAPQGTEDDAKVKDLVLKHLRDEPLFTSAADSDVTRSVRKAPCKLQQRAVFSGKILSFGCSVCKDDFTYSPNDLLKHFQVVHRGTLPTYPCDLCSFVTNEFPALQRHRIEHRNTLVTCELCDDGVQYSLLLLTRHYILCHSLNGQFSCDWCDFTTVDAGTFVQHIHHHNESPWRCSRCRHISSTEEEHQQHVKAHAGTFPFTCQLCGFGAARSESLRKHAAAVHKEGGRRSAWRAADAKKSGEEVQRVSRPNGRLVRADQEETRLLDVSAKRDKTWLPRGSPNAESVVLQEVDGADAAHANGLTVLMVKNKISLPPHCTTKVMGFKMVDGKKHLVLKVIPAASQNPPSAPALDTSKGSVEDGEGGGAWTEQDDIVAVKVKIEEEETSVCPLDSSHQEAEPDPLLSRSSNSDALFCPASKESDPTGHQNHPSPATCSEDPTSHNGSSFCADKISGLSEPGSCRAEDEAGADRTTKELKENLNTTEPDPPAEKTLRPEVLPENGKRLPEWPSGASDSSSEPGSPAGSDGPAHHSPNQEVFSFHNYSKEALSHSPSSQRPADKDPSFFNLRLAESPEPAEPADRGGTDQAGASKVSDGDMEADDPLAESLFQDFNIIKVEEESVPVSRKQPEPRSSASLGSFVEEHSDEIITQQLHKDRAGASGSAGDPKPTKTTVRIVQLAEGQQPVFLRTGLPPQATPPPGFKLITSSANPQINVSYMKPGTERCRLSPNSRRPGVPVPKAGPALFSTVQPVNSSRFLINSSGFKGPVLLSGSPQNTPADKTQPTCYLVQRSVPLVQSPPGLRLASAQLPLKSRPVLTVSSADKPGALQPGRQAFLLRYISPPKPGLQAKPGFQSSQASESSANKVIFKIVSPTSLTSGSAGPNSPPLFLATRPQTQCFLVSNKSHSSATNGLKQLIAIQNPAQTDADGSCSASSEPDRPVLAPRPVRPPSQRKRRRKPLFDELPPTAYKARRVANKVAPERDGAVWKPVAKDVERTLRLSPFSSGQQVKYPRRAQPVVVLNHPDAEIPEVAHIMKAVNRYRGAVTKVSLSQNTVRALAELGDPENRSSTAGGPSPRAVQSAVRERFLLKLKLRKKSRRKYEVVETSGCRRESVAFECWFCGRLFSSQEDWVGHGQRHLMEATRDWNKLF